MTSSSTDDTLNNMDADAEEGDRVGKPESAGDADETRLLEGDGRKGAATSSANGGEDRHEEGVEKPSSPFQQDWQVTSPYQVVSSPESEVFANNKAASNAPSGNQTPKDPFWVNGERRDSVMSMSPSSKPKKDLHECLVSEFSGLLPLQLGAEATANVEDGFSYILDAPSSGMVRKGEDPLTYLNKDQFYSLTLQHSPNYGSAAKETVSSVIMLQFRDRKTPEEARAHWAFWQARQHSAKMRLLDVDAKESTGLVGSPLEIAHNAVVVTWNPSSGPAVVMIAIRCLSTDFSSQKGVKGIPLHIQIDTYGKKYPENVICDRAFCQIKTFCDKGAERKLREEEKRMTKRLLETNHNYVLTVQSRSVFQNSLDLVSQPILYTPRESDMIKETNLTIMKPEATTTKPVAEKSVKAESSSPINLYHNAHLLNRVLLYARQENEEVFTPLHVIPPTVQGLIRAICANYQLDTVDIRYVFRQTARGIIVKVDDDMIKYYCNGDAFIMKVLATEVLHSGNIFYDVVFTETDENGAGNVNIPTCKGTGDRGVDSARCVPTENAQTILSCVNTPAQSDTDSRNQ